MANKRCLRISAQNASGKCWYHHIFYISAPTGTKVTTLDNPNQRILRMYTALQKFGNTPSKVWFWTISFFGANTLNNLTLSLKTSNNNFHFDYIIMAIYTCQSQTSCEAWLLVFNRFLAQHTLIASAINCQLSLEYNEPIRTQFRSYSLQILNLKCKFFLCINCLCNKICFHSLCCPLSVQKYHKLKRIHGNIVQNPTFLERFQTFGGQCISLRNH